MLAASMLLDLLTGVAAALYTKTLNSNVSYKGIAKKIGIWGFVAFAALLEQLIPGDLPIFLGTCLFFIGSEGLSIMENNGRMGIGPPFIFKDALEKLTNTSVLVQSPHVDVHVPPSTAIAGGKRVDDPPAAAVTSSAVTVVNNSAAPPVIVIPSDPKES